MYNLPAYNGYEQARRQAVFLRFIIIRDMFDIPGVAGDNTHFNSIGVAKPDI